MDIVVKELAGKGELDGAEWDAVYKNRYPKSWWYHMKLCLQKKHMLLLRDTAYIRSQVMSALVMGEAILPSIYTRHSNRTRFPARYKFSRTIIVVAVTYLCDIPAT